MRATEFEFRQRFWFIGLIYWIGFACYSFDRTNAAVALVRLAGHASSPASQRHELQLIFGAGALLCALAALIRTWGAVSESKGKDAAKPRLGATFFRFLLAAFCFLPSAFCLPASAARASAATPEAPITYALDLRDSSSHLIKVTMTVPEVAPSTVVQFPAWNALYQIRDFVRHVQGLEAQCDGQAIVLVRADLDTWRAPDQPCESLQLRYSVYANEEGPFSSILDEQHTFMNFAQVLFYLPQGRERPVQVSFALPPAWKLVTMLRDAGAPGEFAAAGYDLLADSPAEAGQLDEFDYTQSGAAYRIVVYGDPADYSSKKLLDSVGKITATETGLMRDVPFARYTFMFQFAKGAGGGGMEHRNGCVIGFPGGRLKRNWPGFESTVAHEFFHLWNVKRIRPQGLEPVDYIHGNDTRDLWFSEGVTSTYQYLTLLRAGLINRQTFYEDVAGEIQDLEERPARHFQSAEESGLEAWLEKYPDYFRPERSISYYNKGAILGFLLDLEIRHASGGRHSLDDLMRALNENFARRHRFFTDDDLRSLVTSLGPDAAETGAFFRDYVTGTHEVDYGAYLGFAGLRLAQEPVEIPSWGLEAERSFGGPIRVTEVEPGGNAAKAGVERGDVLLKVNGDTLFVLPQNLEGLRPGVGVEVEVRRRSETLTFKFKLGRATEERFRVEEMPHPSAAQLRVREGWLTGKTD
ncbi:MAG TPA: PDZ domain-containing protein [Terriglobia bacterium]|nr:PDZ domain-containing protein [Terriglobia bacterium]